MRTRLFSIALLAAVSIIPTEAQTLLEDGKTWHMVERMYYSDDLQETDRPYTITVCGDTAVGEVQCKRLAKTYQDGLEQSTFFAALEQDGRLYIVNEDSHRAIFDINLSVGDADGIEGSVKAIDYITVNGIRRKRLTMERWGHLQYLVEGIGLSDDWRREPIANSYYNVLQSVEQNGTTIFTVKDFEAGTTSVKQVKDSSDHQHQPACDLSGNPVSNNTHGKIIIRDGKKIIQR